MSRDDPIIDIDQLWVAPQGLLMTHLPAVRDCGWPSLPSSCEARQLLGDHDPGAEGRHRRDVERMPRGASGRVSRVRNLRVADSEESGRALRQRGAEVLAASLERTGEIRSSGRHLDGYLVEVTHRAAGLSQTRLAEQAPLGGETGRGDGR
jgi:hypothetical protein